MTQEPIKVFFSYSHRDEEFKDELVKHLSILRRQGIISEWHDRMIEPGSEWEQKIDTHLGSADIILLLVSPDFLASNYCWDVEVEKAMKRHAAGEACVIPVVLRRVAWDGTPFSKFQALPKNAEPIASWNNRDDAFYDVVRGISVAVEDLRKAKRRQQEEERQAQEKARLDAEKRLRQEEERQAQERARVEAENRLRQEEERRVKLQQEALERTDLAARSRQERLRQEAEKKAKRRESSPMPTILMLVTAAGGGVIFLGAALIVFIANFVPQTAEDFYERGKSKWRNEDYQGAIADYSKAIELDPNHAGAYAGRCRSRSIIDDQGAITDCTQAIKFFPKDDINYYWRAKVQTNVQDEIADYSEAIKLNPSSAITYYARGVARSRIYIEKQRAIEDFQKAADLFQVQGDSEWHQKALERLKELQA